ncbi:MAG: hypothetical protein FJX29_02745 [Alphaproteobacteria bacterium]|nr:hypothetical protein [Alphaproteobacteria bacterium]
MLKLSAQKTVRPAPGRIALIALVALGASTSILSAKAFAQSAEQGAQMLQAEPANMQPGQQPPPPQMQPGQPGGQEQGAPQHNQVEEVLGRYGQFLKHEKYGDVWKPTQVRRDWRPYEPCYWSYNREMNAWFFDDKTEWGAIVHHYGRWTLDAQHGWLWIPGQEFSPGWVTWSQRPGEVGWAPLPPEQDMNILQQAGFQNDPNWWIWVPANSLGQGCNAPAPQPQALGPLPPPPRVAGGYITQGIITGGLVGGVVGGYVGGYVPPRIIIVNPCWRHPRACHWWPGHRWPRPHHPPHWRPDRPKPGDHAGRPNGGRPNGGKPNGDKPNGGIQCVRAPCGLPGQKPNLTGQTLPRPGLHNGRPNIRPNLPRPNLNRPQLARPHIRPNLNRPFVQQRPNFNRGFNRPAQRNFASQRNFAPRQQFRSAPRSFAPRMAAPRMAQLSFGGNRGGMGGGRGGFRR